MLNLREDFITKDLTKSLYVINWQFLLYIIISILDIFMQFMQIFSYNATNIIIHFLYINLMLFPQLNVIIINKKIVMSYIYLLIVI